jgi:hypothetical protein
MSQCPALAPLPKPQLARSKAVPLPPGGLGGILASSSSMIAVVAPGGATRCVDARLMRSADDFRLSQSDRFLTFGWAGVQEDGYRSDGHKLVDRATGQVIETGGTPVFSPSGNLFAAAYQSESAFAELEGLGVWRVGPGGPIQIAEVDGLPEMLDWRVDGWVGESCVNLSAVPFALAPVGTSNFTGIARERYSARQVGVSWQVSERSGQTCEG